MLHDIGYFSKTDIDGYTGTRHPELGAHWVGRLTGSWQWHFFCLHHSRHYAARSNTPVSRLCVADKLAFAVTPAWFYLLTTGLTGELAEYMGNGLKAKSPPCTAVEVELLRSGHAGCWHAGLRRYMLRWVARHRHDHTDGWTRIETPSR